MRTTIILLSSLPSILFAASITNNIQGVGLKGMMKPYICIQNKYGTVTLKLGPNQTGDANKASGEPNFAGATLRFDDCTPQNSYLGYVGFNISATGNNSISSYNPPSGVHIIFSDYSISSSGNVTGTITYTPIHPNFTLSPAPENPIWQFVGFNLSGLEFDKVINPMVIPNLSLEDKDTSNSDLNEVEAYIKEGMNTVRVPISWGYLQLEGPGSEGLNLSYYNNYIRPLLQTLTQAKVYTIIDLHAYMRYSKFGEQYSGCGESGPCPDGTLILDPKAYVSVWEQLVTLVQKDPKIDKNFIMLDLMNEPVGVPDDKVFTIQAEIIKALRARNFNGYILVEGNNWSGLHSWSVQQWKGKDGQVYTNSSLFTRDNFIRAGIDDLSKILINVHQYLDSNYSGTGDSCLQDLSTIGMNGFNLQSFVDYLEQNQFKAIVTEFGAGKNAASCSEPMRQFLQYLKDNSATNKEYGFAGWTIWSTGHGWGSYNLRMTPDSYQFQVLTNFLHE